METRNRSKPVTRSNSIPDANPVADVTRFLHELSARSTRSSASSSYESVKHAIEKRMKSLGKSLTGTQRIVLTEEYVQAVESALNSYVERLIHALVDVSHHRAGVSDRNEGEYMSEPRATLEEWLLHKEDCAAYFSKIMNQKASTPASTDPIPPPPEFSKAEYSSHALDEENKRTLTSQSVRRVSGRDLIPLLMADAKQIAMPKSISRKLMNQICAHEINSEYKGRGISYTKYSSECTVEISKI